MEDFNENTNNTYVVRRRLAELTRYPHTPYFHYYIGQFNLKMFTVRIQDHTDYGPDDRITHHDVVDVYVYETKRFQGSESEKYDEQIDLEQDSRFKNYAPIKYKEWAGYSTGKEMPIEHLCELVKYLHKLAKLSAFA